MLHIASACTTRQAFVSVFGRYCDGEAIFVATRSPRSSGEDLSFRITLAGGEPIIVASGRVQESYRDGEGPHGRAGMLIRFTDIDPGSRGVLLEMTAHRPVHQAPYGSDAADGVEPDNATRPSGLPRSLMESSSTRTTITAGAGIVPPPPGSLTFKPEATPPPALEPGAPHSPDDEGPTGVKSMQGIAAMSRSARARGSGHQIAPEFHDEASWGERSDLFGDVEARAEVAARDPATEALAECTVYEESGPSAVPPVHHDELGLPPALLKRSSNMSSDKNDAWDDDQTLPPWLRGPAPDEDLDAATGNDEQDLLLSQAAISGVAEAVESQGSRRDLSEPVPSVALSSSFEREALAAVAAEARARRRWPLVLGAAALSGVVGLLAGYAIGAGGYLPVATVVDDGDGDPPGSAKPTWSAQAPPPAAPGPAANDPAEPPDTGAGAAAVVADDEEEEGDEDADESDAKGKEERHAGDGKRIKRKLRGDRCGVDVKSDPDGAEVLVGSQVMGTTPARFELPCGQHEVLVRRSRYADETRKVRLRAGKLDKIDVRLGRPEHKLRIISAPLGATVTLNGKPAGTTPLVVTVKGYQGNRVRIERPGFETWARKVYAKEPLTRLTVKLTPERGSAAAAARSAEPAPAATPTTPSLSAPAPDAGGG